MWEKSSWRHKSRALLVRLQRGAAEIKKFGLTSASLTGCQRNKELAAYGSILLGSTVGI